VKKLLTTGLAIVSLGAMANANINSIQTTTLPTLDIFKMHEQDVDNEKLGNAPRFAIEHYMDSKSMNLNWSLEEGTLVKRQRITALNSVSLNLAMDFNMSKNSIVRIYSADMTKSIRDFTAADNNIDQELWTPVIMSDDIIVEVRVPADEAGQTLFNIKQVNQGYRTFTETTEKSGSCNVDVACSESAGWEAEVNSVAVISTGGSTFCTGFMVNNTSNDKTPYFMTAKHCRITSSNAASLVTYWNYQASSCGGSRDGAKREFNTGSQFLAGSSKSDFTLVRLNQQPDDSWNVRYSGWDRSGEDASSAVAIHHPSTDEKSISFENEATTVTSYGGEGVPGDATHVRIEDWDIGTTEPGSSGSPLFDQNHRVIGQLHGGYASCTSQTSDWYGRLHTSWEGDGSSDSRLKDHLDAANTGDITTDPL
jgi:lysyl endopeptidase